MQASEILRKLADLIDAKQSQSLSSADELDHEVTPKDAESDSDLTPAPEVFLPPLQMKLELLKKATGVDNVYDDESEEEEASYSYDDLDAIKRNAGINTVVIDALGDDEPLEG